jgi:hypothetical protein
MVYLTEASGLGERAALLAQAPTGLSQAESLPASVPAYLWTEAEHLARRYIWWQPSEKTLQNYPRFLAHAMNLATWKDQCWLESMIPYEHLRLALKLTPSGVFTARSWNYWHVRLGEPTPVLPEKYIP